MESFDPSALFIPSEAEGLGAGRFRINETNISFVAELHPERG
ncbi:MAG: hypothetical protein U9R44_01450 [Candidatus Omnitrophota bacterium]|nr:hypothetical protein [Candidatus Omnitrophota bacterium]